MPSIAAATFWREIAISLRRSSSSACSDTMRPLASSLSARACAASLRAVSTSQPNLVASVVSLITSWRDIGEIWARYRRDIGEISSPPWSAGSPPARLI